MKLCKPIYLLPVIVFHFSSLAATYTGRVIDNSQPAKPIANATVSLMGSAAVAYSDSSGRFSLNTEVSVLPRPETKRHFDLSFSKGRLSFSCHQRENVRIDLFTMNGKRACALFNRTVSAGDFSFALSGLIPKNIGSAAYIAAIEKGGVRYATKVFLANAHTGGGMRGRGDTAQFFSVYFFSPKRTMGPML